MILCIEKNHHLAQMYKFKLEKMFDTTVSISKSIPANINSIKKSTVILMLNSPSSSDRRYVKDHASKKTQVFDMRSVRNPLPFLDFNHISERIGDKFFYTRKNKPFIKIPIDLLDLFKGNRPFDIYYKHNFSYVKEIVKDDFFYIKNEQYDVFTKLYITRFQSKMDHLLKVKDQLQLLSKVKDRALEVGIDAEAIQSVDKIYIGMINNTDSIELKEFYKKKDYLSEHSLFLSYLLIDNLENLGFSNEKKEMAITALFHDFFIVNEKWNDKSSSDMKSKITYLIKEHQLRRNSDYKVTVFNIFHDYAHYRYEDSHEQSLCRLRTKYPKYLSIIANLIDYN